MTDAVLRILLVEDEPAHADAVVRSLRAGDPSADVRVAGTLREFREAVAAAPPDLVLLDLVLPDGRAIEALTSLPESRPYPILIMTSHGDEQTAVAAMKAGALDYIVKSPDAFAALPLSVGRALREWSALIERKRAEESLRESESQLSNALQMARAGHWEYDVGRDRFTFNDNFYRIFRTTAAEMGGYEMSSEEYARRFFHPDDLALVGQETRAAVEATDPKYTRQIEHRILYADGEVGTITVRFFIVKDAQGRTIKTYGVNQDITERKRAEERLRETLGRLRQAIASTVGVLSLAVEARDPYTAGHQRRTTFLAEAIARELGFSDERIESLRLAGLVHDIGKISIPAEILSKPSKPSPLEYALLKTHAQKSYEILKAADFAPALAEIVRQHHERMDGSGYPQGLRGEEILVESRILAVADTVEAMSSHRPYRAALGVEAALEEMEANKGIKYDPKVVGACSGLFKKKKFRFPD